MVRGVLPFLREIRKPPKLHYNGFMDDAHEIFKVYRKVNLREQPTDFAYWQSQPPVARLDIRSSQKQSSRHAGHQETLGNIL